MTKKEKIENFIEKYNVTYVSLEKLFKQSDVITLHARAIKATENMINRDSLNLMKSTAIFACRPDA